MKSGMKILNADNQGKNIWLLEVQDNYVKIFNVRGAMPQARGFIAAILENTEVKEKIKSVQTESTEGLYKMEAYYGVSGCRDLILKEAHNDKGFEVIRRKKVLHISMLDKVQDNYYSFSYRELLEIAKYFDLLEPQNREEACKENEVSYFIPESIDSDFVEGAKICY